MVNVIHTLPTGFFTLMVSVFTWMARVINLKPKNMMNIKNTHVKAVILRLSYTGNHNTMECEVSALNVAQTGPNHDK